ncbi:hypothetical protein HYDPIDRAFT_133254 [Hydnomerulius pinastri MD-312]|uniref:Unplaced genomic scaffold scaffold_14, whole genome shotgun sequence n=1 Tax=Hydnomerulius pinastri MD-312 TaxID=994086 RepID=A0A0C9WEJ0_9AGAM|nr:hypothetical protein HYDPIDRAFT_133254 [Hydnomerulius pinastri MD-312]
MQYRQVLRDYHAIANALRRKHSDADVQLSWKIGRSPRRMEGYSAVLVKSVRLTLFKPKQACRIPLNALRSFPVSYEEYTFVSEWPADGMDDRVELFPEDSHHYQLDTALGKMEWRALWPSGDGTISLGPSGRRFTVAMFHQLQCLDIIREELVATPNADSSTSDDGRRWELTEHCMNYLRQMMLCHSEIALESVRSAVPPSIVDLTRSRYTCRNWTELYAAVEEHGIKS